MYSLPEIKTKISPRFSKTPEAERKDDIKIIKPKLNIKNVNSTQKSTKSLGKSQS